MSYDRKTGDPLWVYPTIDPQWSRKIVDELHLHPVTAQILVSRGFHSIPEIRELIYSKLPDLHDPKLMDDMPLAVDRIIHAIKHQEGILIYGDNDVDGMTATSVLVEFLKAVDANVSFYLPNRNDLRENVMSQALDSARDSNCRLLITVDCGITAAQEIADIVDRGIDVIVTDHHEPTAKIPHCIATLNPKLVDTHYPNRELTGVGVAFKLVHGLTNAMVAKKMIPRDKIDLKSYLDLVALGTIADMGALLGENRILVRYGLEQLRSMHRVGLKKLFEVCDLKGSGINANAVASKIAPRLNSLGRIADPTKGVELLLIPDSDAAEALAKELDLNNIERQKIEHVMSEDVNHQIANDPSLLGDKAIVMSSDKWHPGIIAIVTTRLAKAYNRPTLMIAIDDGIGKGSIRTIREFPLLPILKENADLLLNFGGHDFAAGLTLPVGNIPEFRQRFIRRANQILGDNDVLAHLQIDARADFEDLTFDFMDSLDLLEPFGNENPQPVLYTDAVQVRPPRIVGGTHLKFYFRQNERQLEGIGFGMAHRRPDLFQKDKELTVRVAFTPQLNRFQNKVSIQLLIRDFKVL